ncbi:hypothetical protein APHAL10511_002496 [Amanita phalloides]|nr:hypothetical protein APHAL10511_002496 [Amanita phalloides]
MTVASVPSALSIPQTPTPSSTRSATHPVSTALLYFDGVSELVTCTQASFTWNYSGPADQQLSLTITNSHVAQQPSSNIIPITTLITSSVDPSLNKYTWSSVNVPPGWYKLDASIPAESLSVDSTVFYVHAGSNTSCLSSSYASSLAHHTVNVGAIVGGTLGLVGLALAAGLFCLLCARRRKKRQSAPASLPFTQDRKRRSPVFLSIKRWDKLGSVDSHMAATAVTTADPRRGTRQQSIHSISPSHKSLSDSVNLPVLEYSRDISRTRLNGDEECTSPTNSTLLKSARQPSSPPNILDDAVALSIQARLDAYTLPEQARIQNSRRQDKTYPPSTHSSRRRRYSNASSIAASTAMSLVAAPESEMPGRSQPDLKTDPTFELKPRKGARKPVPLYDPSTDPAYLNAPLSISPDSIASPLSAGHPLYTDDPFARPIPVLSTRSSTGTLDGVSSTACHTSSSPHYMARSQSNSAIQRELVHKGSFGFEGRPMHVLIPDLPLPQQK